MVVNSDDEGKWAVIRMLDDFEQPVSEVALAVKKPEWIAFVQVENVLDDIEAGPFDSVAAALDWCSGGGITDVYVDVAGTRYWAGSGAPSDGFEALDLNNLGVLIARQLAERSTWMELMDEQVSAPLNEVSSELRQRRLGSGISVVELARRISEAPEWVLQVENGSLDGQLSLPQVVRWVWGTDEKWTPELSLDEALGLPVSWVGSDYFEIALDLIKRIKQPVQSEGDQRFWLVTLRWNIRVIDVAKEVAKTTTLIATNYFGADVKASAYPEPDLDDAANARLVIEVVLIENAESPMKAVELSQRRVNPLVMKSFSITSTKFALRTSENPNVIEFDAEIIEQAH